MNQDIVNEMIQTRRQLHRRPEEGWTEFESTYLVVNRLKQLGYEDIRIGKDCINEKCVLGRDPALIAREEQRAVQAGVPAEFLESCGHYTGAVATFDTGRPGPVTALRFDIDCVLVQETDAAEHEPNKEGFASERPGLMHACGHDGHTAVGLAVARWVMENKNRLAGKIKLVFQPAEEGVRGGYAIANSGILDDVDYIFGSHCGGKAKPGEIALCRAGFLASSKLDIRFKGEPSHAGNEPHKGHSALMAACAASMMMVGIPRHGAGASRIAVGKLVAGEGRNVTPVNALIQIETRGETAEINQYMVQNVENIVRGTAAAYQVLYSITKAGEATTLIDCPDAAEIVREAAQTVPGVTRIFDLSAPGGSEDFTWMLQRVVEHGGKGCMFRWGCLHHGHHKADFDLQDKQSMPLALGVFCAVLQKVNAPSV